MAVRQVLIALWNSSVRHNSYTYISAWCETHQLNVIDPKSLLAGYKTATYSNVMTFYTCSSTCTVIDLCGHFEIILLILLGIWVIFHSAFGFVEYNSCYSMKECVVIVY